jgi:dihydroorotate dehydrogenase
MGFNNKGLESFARNLRMMRRHQNLLPLGANIGMNKTTEDPLSDYARGVERCYEWADYITVNISSPNTPGLRAWQEGDALARLIDTVLSVRKRMGGTPKPIFFKIAPDLDEEQSEAIASLALSKKLDGLIISNTTTARPKELESPLQNESGGLSGRPLFRPSTRLLRHMRRLADGKVPLIGAGGVSSAFDAYRKIKAGACLVQLYTAMVYNSPFLARNIARELVILLQRDGFKHISDAIGVESDASYDDNMF